MNKIIKFSCILSTVLAFTSCKKFVDVNNQVNVNSKSNSAYIMSGALATTYRTQVSSIVNIIPGTWSGNYAHSTSFTGGGAEKQYEYTNADFDAFDGLFHNASDYEWVKNHADADGVSFWKDPADIMQCAVFQQLVDLYGDVPYSEAFNGLNNITPKYDNQQTIYEDLVVRLDSAMARISRTSWPTTADYTNQDIYFQGSKTNWIRYANTLKLRILMRQSFMPGRDAYIQANINDTYSLGYITANVLCTPGYANIQGKLNPFYETQGYTFLGTVTSNYQYRKMNKVIVNWLKFSNANSTSASAYANADTFRLQALVYPAGATPSMSTSAALSTYVGVPLGAGSGYATASSSPIGPIQVQNPFGVRPGLVMLLAEAKFLLAEATQRGWITSPLQTAEQYYKDGVLSHFRTCAGAINSACLPPSNLNYGNTANAGDAYAQRYLARTTPINAVQNVNFALSTDKIKAILLQKWVSLININGLEAWNEYRKASGTPQVGVPSGAAYGTVLSVAAGTNPEPARFLYPQSELDANNANVPKNIDRFTSKIFWDVN